MTSRPSSSPNTPPFTPSSLIIDSVFNGPARSGHGGVSGGKFAALINERAATVRFESPIPMDVALSSVSCDDGVRIDRNGVSIATVRPLFGPLRVGQFGRLSEGEVRRAENRWLECRAGSHIAPTCFACGNQRRSGGGLRLRPGPVEDSSLYATKWRLRVPGELPSWMVWAALDCPTGMPAMAKVGLDQAVVTARLAVEIREPVRGNGDYQLLSRRIGGEGRRHETEAAMIDERGRAVAVATATWVTVPLSVMQPDRHLVGVDR